MKKVKNANDVIELLDGKFFDKEREHLFSINLNGDNVPVSVNLIALGSDTAVNFSTKIITKKAILDNACGVIIIHNHPSGNVQPSKCDVEQTEKLRGGLKFFEICLIDHIIVSDEKFYSFADGSETSIVK